MSQRACSVISALVAAYTFCLFSATPSFASCSGSCLIPVEGYVTNEDGEPLSGIRVHASSCAYSVFGPFTTTDSTGYYRFLFQSGYYSFSCDTAVEAPYTITPVTGVSSYPAPFTFEPSQATGILGEDFSQDFVAIDPRRYTISGSLGVSGGTLTPAGSAACTVTGANYRCTGVRYGATVTLTPSRIDYTFAPVSKMFADIRFDIVFNFTANPIPKPACSDGKDNDSDGLIDYPADPGCESASDGTETNPNGPQCDDGRDNDGDAKIDLFDPDCTSVSDDDESASVGPSSCRTIDITQDKSIANLGPEQLKTYAMDALTLLRREALRAHDRALGARLEKSAAGANVKLTSWVKQAQVALKQLPNTILDCPNVPNCVSADNSAPITQHIQAVSKLGNGAVRVLNRATRLTSTSVLAARLKTQATVRSIRTLTKQLITSAQKLPRTMSICTQG